MRHSPQHLNPIQEGLRLISRCPVCQVQYSKEKTAVLEANSGAHLVHITCQQCQNSILAVVVLSQLGMSSVGMLTDLASVDVGRVKNRGPVSDDEVLAFYQFLKNNQFNFN